MKGAKNKKQLQKLIAATLPQPCRNWIVTSTCENEAFVRDFPEKLDEKDVKMKLSSVVVVVIVVVVIGGDSGGW